MCRDQSLQTRDVQAPGLLTHLYQQRAENFRTELKGAATMPKDFHISKGVAVAFVVLTVSAIAGIITMVIVYKIEISKIDPTPRPPIPPTITGPPPVIRLPRDLIPESYEIFLQPHLRTRIIEEVNVTSPEQSSLFTGNSTVFFRCVHPTRNIYLHSVDLTVSAPVVLNRDKNEKMNVINVIHHEDASDFLQLELSGILEAGGHYSLSLDFKGNISENLEGLYVSSYVEGSPAYEGDPNAMRYLAATNMEPTDTRKVFPCFDEPEMKAVFNLTIIHRRGTVALGNNLKEGPFTINDDWQYTRFYSTPRMSTYLFAFTVSEFEESTRSVHKRVTIKTFARPEAIAAKQADYAASITGKILEYYENLLGSNYPLTKLDQIALPDLYPAAMENWGLVTYQEGELLYEEGVSSLLQKKGIAGLIAHELAHQWFGNLVTMKWWNEIWLNEGFATYMSYSAVDHVASSFKMKDADFLNDLWRVFEEDALASSRSLTPPQEDVQIPSDIQRMFDAITYSKGALLLRMLADIVGETVFINGIKEYLRSAQYSNTDQKNLWECIQASIYVNTKLSVAERMNRWTSQPGYPVVTINTTNGEVKQKHFLYNDSSESSNQWYVTLKTMSNTSSLFEITLEPDKTVMTEDLIAKKGSWILANVNCTGYYRVNYNPENWERLLTQLETNPHRIPLMNRGQLVDDAFNLARAKLVDVTLALNTTRFLRKEREYIPWMAAVRNLEYFVLMFDRSEVYGPMQAYLREQVRDLYNFFRNYTDSSTVPKEDFLQHNQIIAIRLACSNGLPECLEMARKMFAQWMYNNTNNIHQNLRSDIYCQAVAIGGKAEWEFAWKKFQNSSLTSEKDQLRKALSCTKKIWLLHRYLEYTLNPEKIRLMDVSSTISYVANNVVGHALAWNFIRQHWEYVSHSSPSMLIQEVSSRFSTQFEAKELERFGADHGLGFVVQQAIEQTQVNSQWVMENKDAILEWFERETAS